MKLYYDAAATTPVTPEVADLVMWHMVEEFGNAGSRTHDFGAQAKRAVNRAREQVAAVVAAAPEEVFFTSGATESNNLALLGLAEHGRRTKRRHILTTAIEHKAVLEPLARLQSQGFDVEAVPVGASGRVRAEDVASRVRADTLLVSVMAVNNETGIVQPIRQIAEGLEGLDPYFHVDGAQAFGKELELLRSPRIDLISVSGHKVFAPKGIGALVARRRGYRRPPLEPLMVGGGQERGLRPGTVPVALAAGLGLAAELAMTQHGARREACIATGRHLDAALQRIGARIHGDRENAVPHIVSFDVPGIDSEALMVIWKDEVAVSNGSACTSASYTPSHVLTAMGLDEDAIAGTVRMSWSHLTASPDVERLTSRLALAG